MNARRPDPRASQRPDSSSGPDGGPSRRRRIPGWIWWLVIALLISWTVASLLPIGGPAGVTLPYSAFFNEAQRNNVASVDISGQSLNGTLRTAIVWPPASPQPSPSASGAGAGTASPAASTPSPTAGTTGATTYQDFSTVLPPTGDPALLPLLEKNNVVITIENTSGIDLFGLLLTFGPMLLLIGLFLYAGRQLQSGQSGILGFGGSRARLYDPERPKVTFADVAGEEAAKTELAEVVDFLKEPDRYQELGARLPRGVLLIGPPGTGKTLLARAVAGEAGVPFFNISASEFVEMFVGVGASRVRDLFVKAKAAAPAIVFVDELDAVGRLRGAGLGGGNDEREQTLNQLLVEMDGFDERTSVIVVAATNRPDVLDPALMRPGRFDRQVTIGYPDRAGREAILRIHTRDLSLDASVDLAQLARATPGFSGADLANLANEAALLAVRHRRKKVSQAEFEEALDVIVLGTRHSGLTDPEERRAVAYHEGGHALVARLTPGADPVQKVTIVPHGQSLGATQQRPQDDRRNYPLDYLVARLTVLLGGRAAEEVVLTQPTSGSEADLKQATELARRMVGSWGMSEELGPVSFGVGEVHPFLGRELSTQREYAESTASQIDAAVERLLGDALARAKELITTHRSQLDALAAELQASEVVDARRLDEIIGAEPVASEGDDKRPA